MIKIKIEPSLLQLKIILKFKNQKEKKNSNKKTLVQHANVDLYYTLVFQSVAYSGKFHV